MYAKDFQNALETVQPVLTRHQYLTITSRSDPRETIERDIEWCTKNPNYSFRHGNTGYIRASRMQKLAEHVKKLDLRTSGDVDPYIIIVINQYSFDGE